MPNHSLAADEGLRVPSDPTRVFKCVVASNDLVCQECYRRLVQREAFDHETGYSNRDILAFVDEEIPEESTRFDILDREYYLRERIADRLERATSEHGTTAACWNCGTTSPRRSPPTRSAVEARRAATGLTVTLDEYGVDHDWVRLVDEVEELKRTPRYAGNDFETFRAAVAASIGAVHR
ncbi:hypothetical protein [Halomarina rubra]|uniref:Uncharacterized protein n=1 Tax=Halomarina rubra TaxID=2071873 RepID=A0ABD6AU36_9EURY|nr:hypothetical protein [Halomarina rubra]